MLQPGAGRTVLGVTVHEDEMAKYGAKAQEKVEENMHEMKEGKLKSSSGQKVTNPKQAIAIGLSEARKAGGKVPRRKNASQTA